MAFDQEREEGRTDRPRLLFVGALLVLATVFTALGAWQVQRLFWKLDLIERVEARINAAPVPAPSPLEWANIAQGKDEYRRVTARGRYDYDREVLAQAVTERGAGFWVMTPMSLEGGSVILINRGFVPSDQRDRASRVTSEVEGIVQVTGLLRMTEPGGAFLRSNDPAGDRWYSRDVAAIASAKSLSNVAPFFIDAEGASHPGDLPVGGMTVVSFRNTHLVYALTWFSLALMSACAAFAIRRRIIA